MRGLVWVIATEDHLRAQIDAGLARCCGRHIPEPDALGAGQDLTRGRWRQNCSSHGCGPWVGGGREDSRGTVGEPAAGTRSVVRLNENNRPRRPRPAPTRCRSRVASDQHWGRKVEVAWQGRKPCTDLPDLATSAAAFSCCPCRAHHAANLFAAGTMFTRTT